MNRIHTILVVLLTSFLLGCSDDLEIKTDTDVIDAEGVQAFLSLSVSDFSIISNGTRDEEPSDVIEEASDYENRIDNIWVFQYRLSDGAKLAANYYSITDQTKLKRLEVTLVEQVPCHICVVANTGDNTWGNSSGFNTYESMKRQALSSPEPIMFSDAAAAPNPIPMEGSVEGVNVKIGSVINVPVSRMYAKLKISFGKLVDGMSPKSIEINNIPSYCRVKSLVEGIDDKNAAEYGTNIQWITRSYDTATNDNDGTAAKDKEYIVYIPENLQGQPNNDNGESKDNIAPSNALVIRIAMNYNYLEEIPGDGYTEFDPVELQEERQYTVYPGGNTKDNFNIKRNNVYRINLNVHDAVLHTPSSNCFVVKPGKNIAFEPYNRTEIGSGYKISDYLDPNDASKSKVISGVQILWQTKNAIGDNSKGNKVWFKLNESDPLHSRIIVSTQQEGNALIGAFNKDGEIIWSWHIWIRENDPSNVGQAVVYRTYTWDASGIKANEPRVDGYAVMPCNLGALVDKPASKAWADIAKTYGMLYQWGRKDPFPPLIKNFMEDADYSSLTEVHYDYKNTNVVSKTSSAGSPQKGSPSSPNVSFFSYVGSNASDPIKFSIQNPLVFIVGTKKVKEAVANLATESYYFNKGDWMAAGKSDNKLWGGKDPTNDLQHLKVNASPEIWIYDNYGSEKTIFDPCPTGWRVPPGDLWLGFSSNGLNSGTINYDVTSTNTYKYNDTFSGGMFVYMRDYKNGTTLYFPTQGPRVTSGNGYRVGVCGNYHNATVSTNNRVNILHVHNGQGTFAIFETGYTYTRKSIGGPIRCVRDRK
ncbi:MAG: DUF4906 domain-containing protein [Muribaculaceae bacterium]|nr:DUF4906 domain-containing protein [Muribaculaceae bacterium]